MVTLTRFKEIFEHFKCGEVYCETPSSYNVNCSTCGKKLPFNEFPEHYRESHFNPQKEAAGTKDVDKQDMTDEDLKQIDRFNEEEFLKSSNTSSDDSSKEGNDLPIEFMEVRLPKLKSSKAESFLPEHAGTMDVTCFVGVAQSTIDTKSDELPMRLDENLMLPECTEITLLRTMKDHTSDNGVLPGDVDSFQRKMSELREIVGEKFTCIYCQRTYKLKRNLRYHIRVVHEKASSQPAKNAEEMPKDSTERPDSLTCSTCGKQFSNLGNLNTHKKRHSGVKSHKCPDCGKFFYTDHEMRKHMFRHTDLLAEICEVCGRGFRNSGKLKSHMRRHTGERPFKCSVCGKCFYSQHDLNVHSVTHTTERPFTCDVCGSTFRTKKALRVHKKLHVAERPHKCNLCSKAFLQLSGLDSHMSQVHRRAIYEK